MRKFTLFAASLFTAIGAMAAGPTPVLTFENPDVSQGPVELTSEQAATLLSCDGAITVIAEVTLTNNTDAMVFGGITDYTYSGTQTAQSNIIGLGTGPANGQYRYRIHVGTNGSYFYTKSKALTSGATTLHYVLKGSEAVVYYADGTYDTQSLTGHTTSNIFSDGYKGENSKFYIGGVKYNTSSVYAPFSSAGTISSISFYDGEYTPAAFTADATEEEKAEALALFDDVKGKVGYPVDSVFAAYEEAVNNATATGEITEAIAAVYNSTEINLPEDGKAYTFTFVDLQGEKHYINYNGTALELIKLEDGATIPYTAMFRTHLNEDGTTYSVMTYNRKYVQYPNVGAPLDAASDRTKITFDKMHKSGQYVSVENEELFGYARMIATGTNGAVRVFVAAKTSFDNSGGYHFEYRSSKYFTTALMIEEFDAPACGKYYRLKGDTGKYVDALNLVDETNKQMKMSEEAGKGTIFYLDHDMTLLSYATGTPIKDTRHLANANEAGNPWAIFPSTSYEGKYKVMNTTNSYYLHDNNTNGNADRCNSDGADHAATHSWTIEEVEALPVDVSEYGYTTIYAPVALSIPDGINAYTVTVDGERANLEDITGGVIPANTGVVLESKARTVSSYSFAITTAEAFTGTNALSGTIKSANVEAPGFMLNSVNETIGFYKAEETDGSFLGQSHQAYLPLPADADSSTEVFKIYKGDNPVTGIEEITVADRANDGAIYDLQGRRVFKAVKGGIYIINGTKILIK